MGERRPVPGRTWAISQRAVDLLVALGLTPNAVSVLGMVLGILAGLLLALTRIHPGPSLWLLAALLIFLRSAMNIFDGMIAHRTGNITPLGGFVNDFTDRIADVAMLLGLGYADGSSPLLGALATIAALLTATVRTTGKAAGAPMIYGGIMSKPVRMYTVILASLGMAISPQPWLPGACLWVVMVGSVITVLQRTWSLLRLLPSTPEERP